MKTLHARFLGVGMAVLAILTVNAKAATTTNSFNSTPYNNPASYNNPANLAPSTQSHSAFDASEAEAEDTPSGVK